MQTKVARRRQLLAGALLVPLAACGGSGGSYAPAPPPPAPSPASKWAGLASLADGPRQETGVCELNGEVFVVGGFDENQAIVGGEGNNAASNGVFDQHEVYDPATDSWSTLERMRTPRHGSGAVALNGLLFVPGGATREGFGAVAVNESFTP